MQQGKRRIAFYPSSNLRKIEMIFQKQFVTSVVRRALGICYNHVRKNRELVQALRERQKKHIIDFDELISILKKGGQERCLSQILMDATNMKEFAKNMEDSAAKEHQGLRKCQLEIHTSIANFVRTSDKLDIVSLDDLPSEIYQRVNNRDLFCANLSKNLRSSLTKLLNTALRLPVQKSISELESWLVSREARDKTLEQALEKASQCAELYNGSHCDGSDTTSESSLLFVTSKALLRMGSGSSRLSDAAMNEPLDKAVTLYEKWDSIYFSKSDSSKSDGAMENLKTKLVDEVSKILSLSQKENTVCCVEQAFENAGKAINDEHVNQMKDVMATFPSPLILHAGRCLLVAWRKETEEFRYVWKICKRIESFLEESDGLTNSGYLCRDRNEAIQDFKSAKEKHQQAVVSRHLAEMVKSFGKDAVEKSGVTIAPSLEDSKVRVHETTAALTRATLKLINDIQPLYPEVILFIGQGLPPELGALWRPDQELENFDERKQLSVESRHTVWKVKDGNDSYAVKEYRVTDSNGLRTCIKEAAIIHRHRHHCIVELCALFQSKDGNAFFIQMPWYEYGTLENWVNSTQNPEWNRVRSVLLDALIGLAHLHAGKVIHGDVKPQNILVDFRERGRLADFDISIDTSKRVSTSWRTSQTSLGFTLGYQAPELSIEGRANEKTDMYAFGKTIESLLSNCNPKESQEASESSAGQGRIIELCSQTKDLIQALLKEDPGERPCANKAMNEPFFATLNGMCRVEAKICLLCQMSGNDCGKKPQHGTTCSAEHFHCANCLTDLTQDLLKVENGVLREKREARVMCCMFPSECTAPGFSDKDLALHLPGNIFQQYLQARIDLLMAKTEAALEEQVRMEVEAELDRLKAMNEVEQGFLKARKHIEEEILQMKCPRCSKAFYDFDGCFAISCHNCTCNFCGWCLMDCGTDAHPHCRRCPNVPVGVDPFFPVSAREKFEKAHKERCRANVCAFLRTLNEATQGSVKKALLPQLQEIGLSPI
jgi:serine/threonine protein kinase